MIQVSFFGLLGRLKAERQSWHFQSKFVDDVGEKFNKERSENIIFLSPSLSTFFMKKKASPRARKEKEFL